MAIINLPLLIGKLPRSIRETIREERAHPGGKKSLHTMWLYVVKRGVVAAGLDTHFIGVTLSHKHNRNMIIIRCRWALPFLSRKELTGAVGAIRRVLSRPRRGAARGVKDFPLNRRSRNAGVESLSTTPPPCRCPIFTCLPAGNSDRSTFGLFCLIVVVYIISRREWALERKRELSGADVARLIRSRSPSRMLHGKFND